MAKAMSEVGVNLETAILERINLARVNPWDEVTKLATNPTIPSQATPEGFAEALDRINAAGYQAG